MVLSHLSGAGSISWTFFSGGKCCCLVVRVWAQCWLDLAESQPSSAAEREEIAVVNHRERVRPPEVELEIAICILSILGELLSCRPQIKAILNHSTSHWGGGVAQQPSIF